MAFQLLAEDNFNRASGITDYTNPFGAAYTAFDSSVAIYFNASYGNWQMVRNTETYDARQYVTIKIGTLGAADAQYYMFVRADTAGGTAYMVDFGASGASTTPRIRTFNAESFNTLATLSATTFVLGDEFTLGVENDGSGHPVVSLYKNGTLIGSHTDTTDFKTSGGKPGFGSWTNSGGSPRIDHAYFGNIVDATNFDGTSAVAAIRVLALPGSGVFGTLRYVSGILVDAVSGNPLANLTNLHAAWFDQADPALFDTPTDVTTTLTTNGSGAFQFNLPNTLLSGGQRGALVIANSALTSTAFYKMTVT